MNKINPNLLYEQIKLYAENLNTDNQSDASDLSTLYDNLSQICSITPNNVLASVGLQILFMEIASLSVLLELTTVDYLTLALLLAISLTVLIIGEVYKLIVRKREKNN